MSPASIQARIELESIEDGDGYRESTESWSEVLRDLKRRGMRAGPRHWRWSPGFLGALRKVFSDSREQTVLGAFVPDTLLTAHAEFKT